MKNRVFVLLILLILAVLEATGRAQISSNGNLESWGATTGTPPVGTPTSWTSSNVIQTPGLVSGSTYSAFIQAPPSGGFLYKLSSAPLSSFQLTFTLAATDPGSTTARSFNLQLNSPAATTFLNLRTVEGSSAGLLSLEAFNGSAWVSVAADAFNASVYSSASNTFTTLNAYTLTLTSNLSTDTYSITYGVAGSGTTTTLSNLTSFAISPTALTLSQVYFNGGSSASGYALDNVSLAAVAVPEPSQWALLLGGGIALLGMARRSGLQSRA